MKVYICHPYGGKQSNVDAIANICRQVLAEGHMPVSPVHAFSWLDDRKHVERKAGLAGALILLEMCDEVWVYGDWEKSEGCGIEIELARKLEIPIMYMEVHLGQVPKEACSHRSI